jgi:succinate dehydrogenase/fumarate reductase flavoprotein subunit
LIENININSTISCDILIVGGNSAGLLDAIEAHDTGIDVLIISKIKRGNPHTVLTRGSLMQLLVT